MKRSVLSVALLGTMALACASTAAGAAEHHASWSYSGHTGPEHWGDLAPDFAVCKNGKSQSPFDIQGAKPEQLAPIDFRYQRGTAKIVNNGHSIEVRPATGNSAAMPAGDYQLVQFHFHAPSEYTIDGKQYPLAAHLVHRNEKGQLAVVGVLFEIGAANKALAPVFSSLPKHKAAPATLRGKLDVAGLLPTERSYYSFAGSLTTPPCSEGVQWYVLKQPVTVSHAQLEAFRKLYPMNARPIQPAHGREVAVSQ
ncbi:carbonic anhydrase family protein [Cupriavidus sp. BIS7]|uniref:carbonic anhydrase n=1 Tax=Cupriavidus sp. BIS7 TaxID=1217718 RepID=UPI00031A116A|nr:carbonic anhydrase family protein [Cupriavidus sp. BIS7]